MRLRIIGLSEVLRLFSTDGEAQHSLGYPIASYEDADFRPALRIARLERARKRLVHHVGLQCRVQPHGRLVAASSAPACSSFTTGSAAAPARKRMIAKPSS